MAANGEPSSKRRRAEAAPSNAKTLSELLDALASAGTDLPMDLALRALKQLPGLITSEVLPPTASQEDVGRRLAAGEALEAPALLSRLPVKEDGLSWKGMNLMPYLWVHKKVEEALVEAGRGVPIPFEQLADIGEFLGVMRLDPSMSRRVLADAANETAHRLSQEGGDISTRDLAYASRFARGVAMSGVLADNASGAMAQHHLFGRLAKTATAVDRRKRKNLANASLPYSLIHDCALCLALSRPWDDQTERIVESFAKVLPHRSAVSSSAKSSFHSGGFSAPGATAEGLKENQDAFVAVARDHAAVGCVLDGHGRHGAAATTCLRQYLEQCLPHLAGGSRAAATLADALLSADAALLLDKDVDVRLCGATCAVARVEALPNTSGSTGSQRRLAVAHLGDCRVILGRRKEKAGGESATWHAVRLTKDHKVGSAAEVARIVADGGSVRCVMHENGTGATDVAAGGLSGVPRLYSRLIAGAPGLAVSRGLGDTVGQSCGLSPQATTLEAPLRDEDLVVILVSDGVGDVLADLDVLQRCLPYRSSGDATAAASAVVAAAGRAWAKFGSYRDDASCVVMFV